MAMAPATTSSRPPAYARALAFERAMRVAGGLAEPIPHGLLVTDGSLPLVWDVNTLWIDDARGLRAEDVAAETRRRQAPLGLTHRAITVLDEEDWQRLTPGLDAAGYQRQVNAVMIHGGTPPAPPEHEVTVDPPPDLVEAAAAAYIASEPFGADQEAARQVLAHVMRAPAGVDERWFTVVRDGAVIAYARLWHADGVAQVEDVVVLAPWRRRGLGRAVVGAATRAALALGSELLFIVADDDDWPKRLYAQLGFATAGRLAIFRQIPAAD